MGVDWVGAGRTLGLLRTRTFWSSVVSICTGMRVHFVCVGGEGGVYAQREAQVQHGIQRNVGTCLCGFQGIT